MHALEDAGYYCVDNLPPELLLPFVELEQHPRGRKVAIAMDVRSAASLPLVPSHWPTFASPTVEIDIHTNARSAIDLMLAAGVAHAVVTASHSARPSASCRS